MSSTLHALLLALLVLQQLASELTLKTALVDDWDGMH